jgi:hypothetical protein
MSSRDFEFISVSMDDPKDEAKVKAFLEKQHAASPKKVQQAWKDEGRRTNNYLYGGTDAEALLTALDPKAPGPLPHTVVIAPGGEIVYRRSGSVDQAELLGKLIDLMGGYYVPNGK